VEVRLDWAAGARRRCEAARPVAILDLSVVTCPCKRLASFDVEDAGVFFGRERRPRGRW
jgi:hypothetical protein